MLRNWPHYLVGGSIAAALAYLLLKAKNAPQDGDLRSPHVCDDGTIVFLEVYDAETGLWQPTYAMCATNDDGVLETPFAEPIGAITPETFVSVSGGSNYTVTNASGNVIYQSTDAHAALTNAQAKTSSSGAVILRNGTYMLKKCIRISNTVAGDSVSGTVLKAAATSLGNTSTRTLVEMSAPGSIGPSNMLNGITLTKLTLDGNKSVYPGTNKGGTTQNFFGGVQMLWAKNCTVSNIQVLNMPASHGIQFQASSNNTVSGCTINTVGSENLYGAYGNGVCTGTKYSTAGNYNTVQSCTITNCSMVGLNVEPGSYNKFLYCNIKGTSSGWFQDTNGKWYPCRAITVWSVDGYPVSTSNQFQNCTYSGLGLAASINGPNTKVMGCTFTATGCRAAKSGYNQECYAHMWLNNDGIRSAKGSTVAYCTFNTITNQDGIRVGGCSVNLVGNKFNNLGSKSAVGITGSSPGGTVVDNISKNFTSCVTLNDAAAMRNNITT